MLAHARDEVLALAARCHPQPLPDVNGWRVDMWEMDDADVEGAIAAYAANLAGGVTDPVLALLHEDGIDLKNLLIAPERRKDDITRSDLTELTAAASIVAAPGCNVDMIHMPNVPKMSRRKSESGLDVSVVQLKHDMEDAEILHDGERLTIVSVKHSVAHSAGSLRWKLIDSLSDRELGQSYMTDQLRTLHGRLVQEGRPRCDAARIYYFLRDFPDSEFIDLFAVGIVDPDLKNSLIKQLSLLPDVGRSHRTFRIILFPGLRTVHERCP